MQACAVCRKRPSDAYCGMMIYTTAECPICLDTTSPLVALPCGHLVCTEDFKRLGGSLKAEAPEARHVSARTDSIVLPQFPANSPIVAQFSTDSEDDEDLDFWDLNLQEEHWDTDDVQDAWSDYLEPEPQVPDVQTWSPTPEDLDLEDSQGDHEELVPALSYDHEELALEYDEAEPASDIAVDEFWDEDTSTRYAEEDGYTEYGPDGDEDDQRLPLSDDEGAYQAPGEESWWDFSPGVDENYEGADRICFEGYSAASSPALDGDVSDRIQELHATYDPHDWGASDTDVDKEDERQADGQFAAVTAQRSLGTGLLQDWLAS